MRLIAAKTGAHVVVVEEHGVVFVDPQLSSAQRVRAIRAVLPLVSAADIASWGPAQAAA